MRLISLARSSMVHFMTPSSLYALSATSVVVGAAATYYSVVLTGPAHVMYMKQCMAEGDDRSLCYLFKLQADIVSTFLGTFLSSVMSGMVLACMSARTLDVAFNTPSRQRWSAAVSWLATVPLIGTPLWIPLYWLPLHWVRNASMNSVSSCPKDKTDESEASSTDEVLQRLASKRPPLLLSFGFALQYIMTGFAVLGSRGPHSELYMKACVAIYAILPFLGWSAGAPVLTVSNSMQTSPNVSLWPWACGT